MPPSSFPWHPLIYFLSLWGCLLQTFHINNLPSVSWRPRKASGVAQSESKGLRTRGVDGAILSPPAGENQCSRSSVREKSKFSLHFLLLFRRSVVWIIPTHTGNGNLLSFSQIHPEIKFIQISKYPCDSIKLIHKINHYKDHPMLYHVLVLHSFL